jgi:transcriptional regulator with XRE-family HTH domain
VTHAALHDDFDAASATLGWLAYLRSLAGETASQTAISERTGVDLSTVNRWFMRRQPPSARTVVQVAHAYGVNPIEALISAGYLDRADLDLPPAPQVSPRDFSLEDLMFEITRRARERD